MGNRRRFLKQSLAGGTLLVSGAFPWNSVAGPSDNLQRLTILHTNDVHSRIDPFPMDHRSYPGMGGAAKRAKIVKQIRKESEHVLLLDSGDIFQGTPYFNVFAGEPEMKLMSEMGYDAATMGNHDFDAGMEGFKKQLQHCDFPFLTSNYDFDQTILKGATQKFKVFEKGDLRIGVFGLGIALSGLVPDKLFGSTKYLDPITVANDVAQRLKHDKKCNLVICLSHLGFEYKTDKISDQVLAQKTKNIDIILGGHTHTFLDTPFITKNLAQKPVLINQVGWAGLLLGRIDIGFQRGKKKKAIHSSPVIIS